MWAVILIGVALLFAFVLALCAGGGAWASDDEEPMIETDPPRPYMSPAGYHRHRCSRCECIWEHPNYFEGVELAHLCPECGHDDCDDNRWPRYYGPLPPDVKYARGTHD